MLSTAQTQTEETFGFKWNKRDTFENGLAKHMRHWLIEKYGEVCDSDWFKAYGPSPVVLDAGCGAALSALELFAPLINRIRYIGVDVSNAVDVARARFLERGAEAGFIQSDLQQMPLGEEVADIIFSEGVLHHTDNTRAALAALLPHLKRGGRILFYVYRQKGPIREFTDDYIREALQGMRPDQAWQALIPLTKMGVALGDLDIEIDVPEDIALLDIPAGPVSIQRLFNWHVFKAFYGPDLTFNEMQHINFDWYAPKNAHRQSPEEVRRWCDDLGLVIEHEKIEMAGITIVARKN
ncbi:MAG: class I SAM-dependent methyltransferase [Lysobacterales bacterium]|nr:MAG: class I SAM-dependent methyltransferase [Xanthomonadales bacterium]